MESQSLSLVNGFQLIEIIVKDLKKKFFVALLSSILLAVVLSPSLGISLQFKSITIKSTGQISIMNVYAKSGSAKDIQAAVDLVVAAGSIGNVHIPEGIFNFVEVGESWVTVQIPAGVNLYGSTTEKDANGQVIEWKTILVMPYDIPGNDIVGIPSWFSFLGSGDPAKSSRFSDIMLKGYRSIDPASTSMHIGVKAKNIYNMRVDHCYFRNTAGGGVQFVGGNSASGPFICRGVIDHCILVNDQGDAVPYETRTVDYGVMVSRGSYCNLWEDDISKVLSQYTEYTVFIEDCYFSKWRHCVASNHGAHYVFRYNIIEDDFGYGSLDAHGTYTYVGTRAIEVYNNQFKNAAPFTDVFFHRGGGGAVFNNIVENPGTYIHFEYLSREGDVEKCWPHDLWVWDNSLPPGMPPVITYNDPEKGQPQENVDFFLHAPHTFNYQPYPYPHPLTLK